VLTSVIAVFFYLRIVVMMYDARRSAGRVSCRAENRRLSRFWSSARFWCSHLGILPTRVPQAGAACVDRFSLSLPRDDLWRLSGFEALDLEEAWSDRRSRSPKQA
jgi:hypothetical protein